MIKRGVSFLVLISFLLSSVLPPQALAQGFAAVPSSPVESFAPAVIKGIQIFPNDPLKFNFIVDVADSGLEGDALKAESRKMIRYFLASLTTPEDDMWVNLSPLEPDRIIPAKFGETEMGRDMLLLDKTLKLTASALTDPSSSLGREFWDKVYARIQETYGTTDVPADVFNKVWITPEDATVYEDGDKAFVVGTRLKVMLDVDRQGSRSEEGSSGTQELSDDVMREIILPVLEKEVNEGRAFASLRQIYYAMILAIWFKRNLRDSVLGASYVDQNKVMGVDLADKEEKQRIYNAYLEAFQKGAYDLIREEKDPLSGDTIPRKYFSGGLGAVKKLNILGKNDKAAAVFMEKIGVGLAKLFILGVLLTACNDARQRPPSRRTQTQPVERAVTPVAPATSRMNDYADIMQDEFVWESWAQDSIMEFRSVSDIDLENMPLREQVIALGRFIKSPESGLGITYDTRFLRTEEDLQKGGDVNEVVKTKRTICTGFARMLFFMLGHSVAILEVKDLKANAYLHAMNIIQLGGGKVMFVDLSTNVTDGFIMSEAFVLDDYYEKQGDEYRLKEGRRIPWDHQNFTPRDDLNETYRVFKYSLDLPYNRKAFLARFQKQEQVVLSVNKEADDLFDQGNYPEAVDKYQKVISEAADFKTKVENDQILARVTDPQILITNMENLIAVATANMQSAQKGMNMAPQGDENDVSAGKKIVIRDITEDEGERFNKDNTKIHDLMSRGVAAVDEGNKAGEKGDVTGAEKEYDLAKKYFKDALTATGKLKAGKIAQKNKDIFDEMEEIEEVLKGNLKNLDQAQSALIERTRNLGGIDLNARNLKIQTTGRKINFTGLYSVSDLGRVPGFIANIVSMGRVSGISALFSTSNP